MRQVMFSTPAALSQTGSSKVNRWTPQRARRRTHLTQAPWTAGLVRAPVSTLRLDEDVVKMATSWVPAITTASMGTARLTAGRKLVKHPQKANPSRGSVNPTGTVIQGWQKVMDLEG